jgi:hypothetical protein
VEIFCHESRYDVLLNDASGKVRFRFYADDSAGLDELRAVIPQCIAQARENDRRTAEVFATLGISHD